MTREQINKLLPVLQAYAEGKDIQHRPIVPIVPNLSDWITVAPGESANLGFYNDHEYRVKPEPRTIWVNRYEGERWGDIYETEQDAICARGNSTDAVTCKFVGVNS